MRYYRIVISDKASGKTVKEWSSQASGRTIAGALNVELDVPTYDMASPMGAAYIRVWGISLQDIAQATDLNGQSLMLFAGMAAGLPLAKPDQAGLILQGDIQQCFGNWQGTSQTLDLIVNVSGGTAEEPKNIVMDWKAGTPMSSAIESTLKVAFPDFTPVITISEDLMLSHDQPGYYQTITQFAEYVKQISQSIKNDPNYVGVRIAVKEKQFIVYDGSTKTSPMELDFSDLIGQVTWKAFGTVNVRVVMRSKIQVGDYIKLPRGQVTISAQSASQYRTKTAFRGVFMVTAVRHIGNFRQPDADSWITSIDAITTV